MRSSLPGQVGIAIAAVTIGLVAVESTISADNSPISVSGMILMDGEPLARGSIRFCSEGTPQPSCDAGLIENGRYHIPSSEALVPATYHVQVSGLDETGAVFTPESLPSQYNRQSVLRVEIKGGGSHRFDFELTR